jgi:hypothetical protein
MIEVSPTNLREMVETAAAAGERLVSIVDLLAIALEVPRSEIDRAVEDAVNAGRRLREALGRAAEQTGAERPSWADARALSSLVQTLADGLDRLAREGDREKLQALADELRRGVVTCEKVARRERLEKMRARAAKEVDGALQEDVLKLPWPAGAVESLVLWLASQDDGLQAQISAELPELAEFLAFVDAASWRLPPPERKVVEAVAHPTSIAPSPTPELPVVHEHVSAAPTERVDVCKARAVLRATPASGQFGMAGSAIEASLDSGVDARHVPRPRRVASVAIAASLCPAGLLNTAAAFGVDEPVREEDDASPAESSVAEASGRVEPVSAAVLVETATPPAGASEANQASHDNADDAPLDPSDIDSPRQSGEFTIATEPVVSVQPVEASSLPENLQSFERFRTAFWRDDRGAVAPAPWQTSGFERKLEVCAETALRDQRFARLLVFARAGEVLGFSSCPAADDVRVLIGRLGGPRTAAAESDVRRAQLIDQATAGSLRPTLATRVAVFLEAITVNSSRPVAPAHVQGLLDGASFSGAFANLLAALFTVGSTDDDLLARLRAALRQLPTKTPEELSAAVTGAEAELHREMRRLWSAAGGKVERTHCRDAWQQFMTKAQPIFNELLTNEKWDDVKRLDGLLSEHARIADKFEAKFQDRNRMDRAAGELVSAARAVVAARREAGRRSRALQGHGLPELVDAYNALPLRSSLTASDAVFVPLFERLLERHEASNEDLAALQLAEFYRRPSLLESLPTLSIGEGRSVEAASIAEPLAAAAHLMMAPSQSGDAPVRELSHYLRDIGREDLLVHVRPVSDTDAKFAASALGKAQAVANRVLANAKEALLHLRQIAHPSAQAVEYALAEAEQLLNDGLAQEAKPEFIEAWLAELAKFAKRVRDESIPQLRDSFDRLNPAPDERARFERALELQRYAEALALAHGAVDAAAIEDRATLWRRVAAGEFPEPRRTLKEMRSNHESLCELWLNGVRGTSSDDNLRAAFVAFAFDTVARGKNNIRENTRFRRETLIGTASLRKSIAKAGLNPSFIPQITAFRDVAVLTPSVPPTADTFVRSATELLASGTDDRITVLLAPGISSTIRDQLREELRKRPSKGIAVVDDLDLVRLLNPGRQQVNPILALLEIVLEQQSKWAQVNPFESQEGQHTKAEMFVGRTEEAGELSRKAQYSRVFSGRRLGKSALLKHIYDSQDQAVLPSGNRLRVVYVPIVGLDGEEAVVEKILDAFEALGHVTRPQAPTPGEKLKLLVNAYLRAAPKGSVLVFLDEADMFVEDQVARYVRDREKCLTWRMRTELEANRDSMDLPRVRFVFAGYRATHRPEGAWANWGDVLRLRPLAPDAAARLIAGPLARLGINASSEASAIAYRCGYQPAILVRFGQQLIEHLDTTVTPARRDGVQVTPELVTMVYQSAAVQQEIRTIVWNNFQGNPFGQIVFAALLLEFARMPPGAALEDAPSRVLQRLRSLVPTFLSNESIDGFALDRVARTLRDFVDRSLIREVQAATQSYQLRFPHQLNVLLQEDQAAVIRREASALGGEGLDAIELVRSMVPRGALEDLSYAVANDGFSAAVVVTHWSTAVDTRAADVAARLGYAREDVADVHSTPEEDARWHGRRLALFNASPESAERTLRAREGLSVEPPLLIGGMDLLRWSLRRGRDVELASVPRLSQVQLRWWFERVREINFTGLNPVRTFVEMTAGIPYLVGLLDRELEKAVGFEGASATEVHIAQAVSAYEASLERYARELLTGDPSIALARREQELLVMISLASDEAGSRTSLLDMLISPTDYSEFVPGLDRWRAMTADDRLALGMLLRSGLLPSEVMANSVDPFDKLQVLLPGDPVRRVAKVLERCLST